MSAIVFNCQDVTSNGQAATASNDRQYLWFVGRSPNTVGNGKNVSLYIENNGDLYLDWGGLTDQAPYAGICTLLTAAQNIKIRNAGSAASPLPLNTTNKKANIIEQKRITSSRLFSSCLIHTN